VIDIQALERSDEISTFKRYRIILPGYRNTSYFRQAIAIGRWQSAKSLDLRAVMSLSRLWQRQGKQHEARNLLSEIYGWFTEGIDTKDLQEAKALLEKLS
jgi:predicted ATPase